jgi:hypothetical protein
LRFIISAKWNAESKQIERLQCVGLTRKKDLTEPIELTRQELIEALKAGEDFRLLQKIGCRWETGPEIILFSTKKDFYIKVSADTKSSDDVLDLPRF